MSELSEAERQFLVRLLKRSIGYKSNGDIVRQARSLLAKIEAEGVVLQIQDRGTTNS